jgi:very-short-patch-repair endonuclease
MKPGETNKLAILHTLQTIFCHERVETEFRFHPVRKWRFDYAIPEIRLAVEYNGHGGFLKAGGISRHGSIIGMTQDAEKLNSAIGHGWRVLQFTTLHFRAQDRVKHNLKDIRATIMDVLATMQAESEEAGATCSSSSELPQNYEYTNTRKM